MRRARFLFAVLYFACTFAQCAETISFDLYQVKSGKRVALAQGQRTYDPTKDFVTDPEERDSKFYGVRKQLPIAYGYSIGILDTFDHEVKGFGLWVAHLPKGSDPNGFSWEWFNRVAPGEFKKLLGGGRVRVMFSGMPAVQEIARIEFLNDMEFEYIENLCCKPKDGAPTHVLVVRAHSVLAFPTRGSSELESNLPAGK